MMDLAQVMLQRIPDHLRAWRAAQRTATHVIDHAEESL